jgi:predicted DNA-binding transcriptional regulator YafY
MTSASVLEDPAKRPKGFSLDTYLAGGGAQFGTGDAIVIKARVTDELARLLDETPISSDQTITNRAGVHTLTATVRESWQLDFWILSQGAAITVLKPVALRKRIIASLKNTMANYK